MRQLIIAVVRYGSALVFGMNLPLPIFCSQGLMLGACFLLYGMACSADEQLKHAKR